MFVIALTGGIGSGKSLASDYFASKGAAVIDLDAIAREALCPGSEIRDLVVLAFGQDVVGSDGEIDRVMLAKRAFASGAECARLNRIVHPAVLTGLLRRLEGLGRSLPASATVVVEVPLLVEAPGFADVADTVLAISAPENVRIERCIGAGIGRDDVLRRVACQASDAERAAIADHVIANDSTKVAFVAALDRFWDEVVGPHAA